jgi:CubicO group peptidase (beta-lactamase class C family)
MQDEVKRQRVPGAVIMISRHGKLAMFDKLGWQDPLAQSPMRLDSLFRIYSMTKPIVSVAVMMLFEQGKLLLADPVAKYLPEYKSMQWQDAQGQLHPVKRAITIQDLLRHTSGLTYEFLGQNPVQQQYATLNMSSRERSNDAFSKALAGVPLMFEPGSAWEYSRSTDVLGRLIEVVSGQGLGAYLQQHILQPLGMHETAFSVPQAQWDRIAEPFAHDPDGGVPMRVIDPRETPAHESGGGGLMSTAQDYARFLQFMLNKGELDGVRLLAPHIIDFMTADHLGAIPLQRGDLATLLPPGHGFGLGFAVRTRLGESAVPGSVGMYYWGGIAGTTFFVDPTLDMYAMMLIQAPNQREYYRPLFRNLVYASVLR